MSRSNRKKSVHSTRNRFRPELVPLENRVVPSTSPTGLSTLLHPPLPAAALTAAPAASQAQSDNDQGIGTQVTAKVEELHAGQTPDRPQGSGTDRREGIGTDVSKSTDADGSPPTGHEGSEDSGDKGIGDQVSAKAKE